VFIMMLYIGLHCDELINIPKTKVSKGLAHFLYKDFAILLSPGRHSQQGRQVRNEVRNSQIHLPFQMLEEQIHGSTARSTAGSKNPRFTSSALVPWTTELKNIYVVHTKDKLANQLNSSKVQLSGMSCKHRQ